MEWPSPEQLGSCPQSVRHGRKPSGKNPEI